MLLFASISVSPLTHSLRLQAKAKEKQYDVRGEAPRGIQVSYPVPEHVVTPRAREGLRAVVPTIFPPSAVNRGESVHVHALEPERRPRAVTQPKKKRGRKPKLRYEEGDGSGGGSEPYGKRSRLQEEAARLHHLHHHHLHHHHHHQRGETSDHSLIQLTKRFEEKTTITPRSCGDQRPPEEEEEDDEEDEEGEEEEEDEEEEGSSHRWHRTCSRPESRKLKPRQQELRVMEEEEETPSPCPCWTPSLSNIDAVTVTDVTMNLLTVTVRESSTDKGFFRGKR